MIFMLLLHVVCQGPCWITFYIDAWITLILTFNVDVIKEKIIIYPWG